MKRAGVLSIIVLALLSTSISFACGGQVAVSEETMQPLPPMAAVHDWLSLLLSGIAAAAAIAAVILYGVFSHRLVGIQMAFNRWTESLRDPSPNLIGGRVLLFPPSKKSPEAEHEDAKFDFPYREVLPEDKDSYLDTKALAGTLTLTLESIDNENKELYPGRLCVSLNLSNPGDTPIYGSGEVEIRDRETGTSVVARHIGASKEPFSIPPRDKGEVDIVILLSPESSSKLANLLNEGVDVTLSYITGSGKKRITFERVSSFRFKWPGPSGNEPSDT